MSQLERRARQCWSKGEPVPLDLFYEMLNAGLDVGALEAQYKEQNDE